MASKLPGILREMHADIMNEMETYCAVTAIDDRLSELLQAADKIEWLENRVAELTNAKAA